MPWGETIRTIQVIGVGNVGSQVAFGILCRFSQVRLALTDTNSRLLEAQYFDLASANMMLNRSRLFTAEGLIRADIYVLASGHGTDGHRSRGSLYAENGLPCKEILARIADINPDAWAIIVTNPSHRIAQDGLEHLQRVIPVGKMLDRTRQSLSPVQGTHENPRSIDIYEAVMNGKGHTAFGPAGEVLRILGEII